MDGNSNVRQHLVLSGVSEMFSHDSPWAEAAVCPGDELLAALGFLVGEAPALCF